MNSLGNTWYGVTIDSLRGTTSGASAADRAVTIRMFADETVKASDFAKPGHVTTLKALDGGVLSRAGPTRGIGGPHAPRGVETTGVLATVMAPDGSVARLSCLRELAAKHGFPLLSIRDIIEYRRMREKLVECVVAVNFPTKYGSFELKLYESDIDDHHHIAIVKGDVVSGEPVLVRVHSECLTGDVFGSLRCDCGEQLARALSRIEAEGRGVVLYMRQEGRGIGLANKIRAYSLQDMGVDDGRGEPASRLSSRSPGLRHRSPDSRGPRIKKIRLMTNNPKRSSDSKATASKLRSVFPSRYRRIVRTHITSRRKKTKWDTS